jgi:hypothetical protein
MHQQSRAGWELGTVRAVGKLVARTSSDNPEETGIDVSNRRGDTALSQHPRVPRPFSAILDGLFLLPDIPGFVAFG